MSVQVKGARTLLLALTVENLAARSFEHREPLADLTGRHTKIDEHPVEDREEVVEYVVVHSSEPRPRVSVREAPSRIGIGAAQRACKETFLSGLEPFDVHAQEKGAEGCIGDHSRIERVEGRSDRTGPADVVVQSQMSQSPAGTGLVSGMTCRVVNQCAVFKR